MNVWYMILDFFPLATSQVPIQSVVHFQLCIMTVIQKLCNQHYDVHKIGDE